MLKFVLTCFLFVALFLPKTIAQESASQMGFSDLIAQAEYLSGNNQSAEAIPLLKEIIARAETVSGADESIQMARLLLASAYAKIEQWGESRAYVEEYLGKTPVTERTSALQILCQIALAEKKWDELNETAQILRSQKGLSLKKQEEIDQFFVQALFNGGNFEKALEILPDVISKAKDVEKLRAYRIMQMQSLYETRQVDKMMAELPLIFRGEARNDVTLNLTLLRMGDELFEVQQYRQALSIYRLVTPKIELLEFNTKQLEEMTAKKTQPEEKIAELQAILEALERVPDYDLHVSYRAAQIYAENTRFWEAIAMFDLLYLRNSSKEEGKAAYLQKLMLLFEVGANDEAVAESTAYLDTHTSGLFPRIVCTRLAQFYIRQDKFQEALDLESRYVSNWIKASEKDVVEQETDLRYLLSFAYFQVGEYEKASSAFDRVIKMSPDSEAGIDSNYWKAMCLLLQKKYLEAYGQFIAYRDTWPRGNFAASALFRAGVCRFGLEDYQGAKTIFSAFIDNYPDDALMPEALSMQGDILASEALIDEALESYDRVVELVVKNYESTTDAALKKQITLPATYAVLQSAQALKRDAEEYIAQKETAVAEDKYRQIITRVENYMKLFGEDADWAQAIFWIGKAQLELGKTDEAVQAYLDVVIRYGDDPAQEGVASILFDLAEIVKTRQNIDQQEQTKKTIQMARDEATSPTLQILIDVLLAELEGSQTELGRRLLANEKDLNIIPPSGLELMCSVLLEQEDYYRAEELYNYFVKHYETSPFIITAYHLRAEDLRRQKKYDEALEKVEKVLELYGATEDTGWAQLLKGRIEMAQGEYKAAEATYNKIFSVRVWRGAVSAEAMLQMAEAWYAQGNYEKAFAFFQRTYLLYKAYDGGKWAADGYLRSAQCLLKLGRSSAARNTYRAMLLDEYVRNLPQTAEAKAILGPAETAELLAGRTNSMETVSGEVAP